MQETWVRSLGWEDPLEKKMATHSSTLDWKIPWTEEPGRLQSIGLQRVGRDWETSLSLSRCLQGKKIGQIKIWQKFDWKKVNFMKRNKCGMKLTRSKKKKKKRAKQAKTKLKNPWRWWRWRWSRLVVSDSYSWHCLKTIPQYAKIQCYWMSKSKYIFGKVIFFQSI